MMRPRRVHLPPPVSYQGGKRRQAPEIVRHMALDSETPFVELCCGSGAVSLELISRGHNPAKITMVDAGPWGDVWRLVGAGEFDLRTLEEVGAALLKMGKHSPAIPDTLAEMARLFPPTHRHGPYAFLFLQSGVFGRKAVGVRDGLWTRCNFSAPGDLKHPPLIPEPEVIVRRMQRICRRLDGVCGLRADVRSIGVAAGSAVYLDPPYAGTTGYGHDVEAVALAVGWAPSPVYVSERVALSSTARLLRERVASGLSGASSAISAEYLSLFNADWPTPDYERATQAELFAEAA